MSRSANRDVQLPIQPVEKPILCSSYEEPSAHGVSGYTAPEGKAIIGLVDLMLQMLKRAEEFPPPDLF